MEPSSADLVLKPQVTQEQLLKVLHKNYGILNPKITQLDGYDDLNFRIEVHSGSQNKEDNYVLKIVNSLDSTDTEFVEAQHMLMLHLREKGINVQSPIKNTEDKTFSVEYFQFSVGNVVRLLTYLPGKVLATAVPTPELFYEVGKFVGDLTKSMNEFKHPSYLKRKSIWMLESLPLIENYLNVIKDDNKLSAVKTVIKDFSENVIKTKETFQGGLIHGDMNEQNILVEDNKVCGLLDFGDSHYSLIIFEIAINICYLLIFSKQLDCPKRALEGYLEKTTMSRKETNILKVCVCGRLCQSLVLGLYSHSKDPGNEYILATQKDGWPILLALLKWGQEEIKEHWGIDVD